MILCLLVVTRFPYWNSCFMRALRDPMRFSKRDFLVRFSAVCCIICDGIYREGAIVVGCERIWLLVLPLWDFLMGFLRFVCWFSSQISLWDSMLFAAYFSDEISLCDFVLLARYEMFLCELLCFCCTIFEWDILRRAHASLNRYELCVWDFYAFLAVTWIIVS
jgi:hypothetical protein